MTLVSRSAHRQETLVSGTLLSAQTTDTNGVWQLINCRPWCVTVRGTFGGATVTIYVSNQVDRPLDSDNSEAVFQQFTAPGSGESNAAYMWVKARQATSGGGTSITVDVAGG